LHFIARIFVNKLKLFELKLVTDTSNEVKKWYLPAVKRFAAL